MTINDIIAIGRQIAAETAEGGNTAARVGGVIEAIGEILKNQDYMSWQPAGNFDIEEYYEKNDQVFDAETNSCYVSLQTDNVGHPVNENDESYEEGWWMKVIDGASVLAAAAAATQAAAEANQAAEAARGIVYQAVDDHLDTESLKPVANQVVTQAINNLSENLQIVASDNVFSADADLEIQDENENVLARFSHGEFKTKNFDSRDVPEIENARVPLDVVDDNGFVIVRFENGHIMTRNFDSSQIVIPHSNLYQKKMCIIGDSYVANHNESYTLTWHYKIAQENEMVYVNYGINGNGLVASGSPAIGTPVIDRYTEMDDDADYVIVVGGKNDYNKQLSIASFKTGLATLCAGLVNKYAERGSRIAFFTPWDDYDSGTDPSTIKLIEYVDAIIEICGKYSIQVFDSSRKSSMFMFDATFRTNYCQSATDISHLNSAGHDLFKNKAFNFLNQL